MASGWWPEVHSRRCAPFADSQFPRSPWPACSRLRPRSSRKQDTRRLRASLRLLRPSQEARPTRRVPARSTNLGADPNGNPLRLAFKTSHVSNYDESKVPPYTLPDPLVTSAGSPFATPTRGPAFDVRNREAVRDEIYGRVPANAPKVTWTVASTDRDRAQRRGHHEEACRTDGCQARRPGDQRHSVHAVQRAKDRCPSFFSSTSAEEHRRPTRPPDAAASAREPPVAAEILARGWGYAMVGYNDIQPDRANAWTEGVIGLTLAPGQTAPAPDEWGTISAWAWGVSRIIDYFETDSAVDAKRIAIQGHSRLGKTVLWASAKDARIAAMFSSCSGEMGAALARRDWGETVDDMAQNFAWQFAGNFQKWAGKWNEMPVDSHMLISLSAPRPVYITGGTTDQWSDPKGEFLAAVAAGPVYKLLGKKDLGSHGPAAARHARDHRRSRLALPHGRTHGDAGRLERVPSVPGEIPSVVAISCQSPSS